jgi:hypothetical protein
MLELKTSANLPAQYIGFTFPKMDGNEFDRFIEFVQKNGYDLHKIQTAGDNFKRMIYNKYAKRYNKKII